MLEASLLAQCCLVLRFASAASLGVVLVDLAVEGSFALIDRRLELDHLGPVGFVDQELDVVFVLSAQLIASHTGDEAAALLVGDTLSRKGFQLAQAGLFFPSRGLSSKEIRVEALEPLQGQVRGGVESHDVGSSTVFLDAYLTQKYYPTQYRLLRSRGLAERIVQRLALQVDPRFASPAATEIAQGDDDAAIAMMAGRILSGVSVKPVTGTELVAVDYVANDPALATETINVLAEEYINWNLENRSEEVGKASRFLQTEVRGLGQEIANKEKQLEEYSRRSDIVTLDCIPRAGCRRLRRQRSGPRY